MLGIIERPPQQTARALCSRNRTGTRPRRASVVKSAVLGHYTCPAPQPSSYGMIEVQGLCVAVSSRRTFVSNTCVFFSQSAHPLDPGPPRPCSLYCGPPYTHARTSVPPASHAYVLHAPANTIAFLWWNDLTMLCVL